MRYRQVVPADVLARSSRTLTGRFDPTVRMWARIDKRGPNECWPWTGVIGRDGYGKFRGTSAQREVYQALVGLIPDGLELDHLCRNRSCVNPAHLEPVTHRENGARSPLWGGTINSAKTHCKRGHPFDAANTYRVRGRRSCRACNAEAVERYRARRPALLSDESEGR